MGLREIRGLEGLFSPVVVAELKGWREQKYRDGVQPTQPFSAQQQEVKHHLQIQQENNDLDPPALVLTSGTSSFQVRESRRGNPEQHFGFFLSQKPNLLFLHSLYLALACPTPVLPPLPRQGDTGLLLSLHHMCPRSCSVILGASS